jgi:hypothetical protein
MISDDETLCCPDPSSFVYFGRHIPPLSNPFIVNKSLEDKLIWPFFTACHSRARFVPYCRTLID